VKIVLRRAAERDFEQIALWYDQRRPGLGSAFMDSVRERLAGIQETPETSPVVLEDIRRALLHRFPYGLFYVIEPDRLVVVGCFHVRQNPSRWTNRR
jgi:plasmid stabilization system protein ParE